jgi:hypothetical protein
VFNQDDSLWAIVKTLSTLQLLFCLILTLVVIYALFSATFIVLHLRSLLKVQNDISLRNSLARLNHRSENLRQIIVAAFYLFGFTFFLQMQNAFWTLDNGRSVAQMVLENFRADFRFATIILLVFLLIHSAQWFASSRIRTALLRLDTPNPE